MRAVVQKVKEASVKVKGNVIAKVGKGILILLGIATDDSKNDCEYLANKIANLRIFPDENSLMNKSLIDINGSVLVVSQFTLLGDCRKGRRPSFSNAASPDIAKPLYEQFVEVLKEKKIHVETGIFQEMMEVYLINDGPVTLILDSKKIF